MLRHFSRNIFFCFVFQILIKAIFLKTLTKVSKNAQNEIFLQKIMFFDFFGQNFQKYCLIQTFEKKKVPHMNMHNFLTQNYYF